MKDNKYPLALFWSNEDNEWVVTCPAFPGLSALGETEEEALQAAKVALRMFIETYEEKGYPLPTAEVREEYSGQTRLRLSKSLHRRAAELADREGVSLNQLIVDAVQARVAGDAALTSCVEQIHQALSVISLRSETEKRVGSNTHRFYSDSGCSVFIGSADRTVEPLIINGDDEFDSVWLSAGSMFRDEHEVRNEQKSFAA